MQFVSGALIARRVLEEVKLMVVLRIEPFSGLNDLRDDLRPMGVKMLLLHLPGHPLGDVFLGRSVVEDSRAVL